jgi:hypothetical protein
VRRAYAPVPIDHRASSSRGARQQRGSCRAAARRPASGTAAATQHPSVRDCVPHVLVLRTLRRTIQRQTAPHPPCLLCLYCMEIWTRLSPLFFISPVHESTRCREDDQSRGAPRPLPVAGKQICGCMRCAACCTWIGRGLPDPFCHHSFIASIVRST